MHPVRPTLHRRYLSANDKDTLNYQPNHGNGSVLNDNDSSYSSSHSHHAHSRRAYLPASDSWITQLSAQQEQEHDHPLVRRRKSTGKASFVSIALGDVTRPGLTRVLGKSSFDEERSITGYGNGKSVHTAESEPGDEDVEDKQLVVLVHEVQPKDNLAGVALKYGITIAQLRRANQLWTSDSIHLRKVLYIPVDKKTMCSSRHVMKLIESGSDGPGSLTTAMPESDGMAQSVDVLGGTTGGAVQGNGRLESNYATIRRIPASRLSFFPPSSRKLPPSSTDHPSRSTTNHPQRIKHIRHATSPAHAHTSNSPPPLPMPTIKSPFSVLFNAALPLMGRLSLESVSTSSSGDDSQQEHELAEVGFTTSSGKRDDARTNGGIAKSYPYAPPAFPSHSSNANPPGSTRTARTSIGGTGGGGRYDSTVKADSIITDVRFSPPPSMAPLSCGTTTIRTVQLEPSPGMQVPLNDNISSTVASSATLLSRRNTPGQGGGASKSLSLGMRLGKKGRRRRDETTEWEGESDGMYSEESYGMG